MTESPLLSRRSLILTALSTARLVAQKDATFSTGVKVVNVFATVRNRQGQIHPTSISHGVNSSRTDRSRFHLEFDWVGTLDPSAWLSVPSALHTMESMVPGGWPEVMKRNHALAIAARDLLCARLGLEYPAPDSMIGSMASVPLPDGIADAPVSLYGDPLQDVLLERCTIEVPIAPWPGPPRRVLRVSAQLYNTIEEYEYLAESLARLL